MTIAPANFSKESEMLVLGSALTNDNSYHIVSRDLDETDFFYSENKIVFNVLCKAFREKKSVDVHLVCEELKRQGNLENIGNAIYILTLAQYAGTSAHIEEYVKNLKKCSQLRKLQEIALILQNKASKEDDPQKIILEIQEHLKRIESHRLTQDRLCIRFLNEFEKNFLLNPPQKKVMLLDYADENRKTVGFLPKGIVAMLVGAGGLGKTHLLAQLAISIATGTPWLDQYTPTQECGKESKGYVFFGLGENQYDDIHRVLFKASKKLRHSQSDFTHADLLLEASNHIAPFSFCGQQAAFLEAGKPSRYFRELKIRLKEHSPPCGWSLIIFDPISRLLGADAEVDNAAATQFITLLEELTIDLPGNPTVLFAHHVNKTAIQRGAKQDQSAARGSSALTDGVRWQVNLSKLTDDTAMLKMTKSNFTASSNKIYLKSDSEGFLERSFVIPALESKTSSKQTYNSKSSQKKRHEMLDCEE